LFLLCLILSVLRVAQAEDPCATAKQRALVLSGGGVKGAFEAGAVYHLVVQRGCDFSEFSGVSVGALNAAFLAQARQAEAPRDSYADLANQTEALVSLWQSLRSSQDIARGRPLATLRFGIFGLDSMLDFAPLRRLENKNISLEKLASGRPLRVGVVSFHDGEYHEILAQSLFLKNAKVSFMDYLYASSTPPVLGKLPRIPEGAATSESQQFADGSLRHITPVASYFAACHASALLPQNGLPTSSNGQQTESCHGGHEDSIPPHEPIQQLFVIVTSPYSRDSDSRPILDPKCRRVGTRQVTDGRKILGRALALLDDEVYRQDLDFLQSANEALTWRWQAYQQMMALVPPEQVQDAKGRFRGAKNFAFESYNRDDKDADAPSLPYEIGLVVPEKEYADLKSLLAVSPYSVQEQLYCGCVAADQMMQKEFGLSSLSSKCSERFTRLTRHSHESLAPETQFDPSVCQGTGRPESSNVSLAVARTPLGNTQTLDLRAVGAQPGSIRINSFAPAGSVGIVP
jgi:hypothetical protein